jgi:dephospho-CoA kinase
MLRIGLTGGIASGKSLVTRHFQDLGASIVDTDVIAREVVEPGHPGLKAIRAQFGDEVIGPDGRLDRRHMRTLVFTSPAMRQQLEAILHPLIRARTLAQATAATGPYVILVVPLLAETSFGELVDRVVVVDCDEAQQEARLVARDSHSLAEARRIIATQASRATRLAVADDVIHNGADLAATRNQVEALHEKYLAIA